jgi:ABC-type phosphate transport system substrate-binding protein
VPRNGVAGDLDIKQFLDFTISGAGQKIVQQVGFVPIP